mmetsp:Transcript_38438/g.108617  ORF Transcript_38438/g.108617 Transcript_38438/m.108617 type:complete len:235 (-) Transcript_38438:2974-3678(-)
MAFGMPRCACRRLLGHWISVASGADHCQSPPRSSRPLLPAVWPRRRPRLRRAGSRPWGPVAEGHEARGGSCLQLPPPPPWPRRRSGSAPPASAHPACKPPRGERPAPRHQHPGTAPQPELPPSPRTVAQRPMRPPESAGAPLPQGAATALPGGECHPVASCSMAGPLWQPPSPAPALCRAPLPQASPETPHGRDLFAVAAAASLSAQSGRSPADLAGTRALSQRAHGAEHVKRV